MPYLNILQMQYESTGQIQAVARNSGMNWTNSLRARHFSEILQGTLLLLYKPEKCLSVKLGEVESNWQDTRFALSTKMQQS